MRNKRRTIAILVVSLLIVVTSLTGCGQQAETPQDGLTAPVMRGDLVVGVTADGNLDMPHEVRLRFGTPGTVKEIYVEEGDIVTAGTLLAKLDDTSQKLALKTAEYDLQLALSEISQTVSGCCQLLGQPRRYPDNSALLAYEQAMDEVQRATTMLEQLDYEEAAARIRLALYTLDITKEFLLAPVTDTMTVYAQENPGAREYVEVYPAAYKAIDLVDNDMEDLQKVQSYIESANYPGALSSIAGTYASMEDTLKSVKSVVGQIERFGVKGADTTTSLDFLNAASNSLAEMQELMEEGDYNPVRLAELLRLAQYELEIGSDILSNNEFVYENGLSLKAARQYNLNVQKAFASIESYKEELLKTEILAPFAGTVVDVGVKVNDQLSATDYSITTAVHLVDTRTVKLEGFVDEIDIFQVHVGQKATVVVDAMPDQEFTGTVTFISPFGTEETGVVNFAITIQLEPVDVDLRGGLTATATIHAQSSENTLYIPNLAVFGSRGDHWAEVVVNEDTLETEKRPITIGISNSRYTEVLSGLNEGETVKLGEPSATFFSPFGG